MSEIADIGKADGEAMVAELLARVGARVRKARQLKGLPRRVVSERSGVSMRYLAQLEAGEGNISIGRLAQVALVLDVPLERLVGEGDPWSEDASRAGRICLVGLRGAGKSTLGVAVGEVLGLPFLELNREIEEHAGMPVTELMALYGPEGYRDLEAQALERVIAGRDTVVLAVAGGIVSEPATYERMLSQFHTVWIKARPEEHMRRVQAQGDLRPMAGNPQAMQQLRAILKSREALYSRAHAVLDTSGQGVAQSAENLTRVIRDKGFV
ncbi:helix-turn-helix transcriptional regulator [Alisedimentitalea sp. MJ-SS2]|uniref:helix-turn-helix transcriptional regulator n=1 Tax=Aliisedimentitalea sp. MJ-SS2 TaxID=3049795 RepID=UPI002913DCC2|nr:helix-turn-helix transcriptional regulator [Alisedimentitalea sp. MJ-SS2]MDU8927383.1 helix-turn-helix transcriptional regulator [Alisedimentitalea sp. MJ-SS2]